MVALIFSKYHTKELFQILDPSLWLYFALFNSYLQIQSVCVKFAFMVAKQNDFKLFLYNKCINNLSCSCINCLEWITFASHFNNSNLCSDPINHNIFSSNSFNILLQSRWKNQINIICKWQHPTNNNNIHTTRATTTTDQNKTQNQNKNDKKQ